MTAPLIHAEALTKDYHVGGGVVHALTPLNLTVARGEFTAVMGPSGSGKSTFMNLVGCLDSPTSGRLLFDGEDVSRLATDALADVRNRKIGFVFQSFNLLARLTAEENVELPLMYGRMARGERRAKAAEMLRLVGLGERGHHRPTQLSGGQQQRVAIARALVNDPLLLLADEPTGALDTRTGIEIMALFQRLNDEGITVLLVTHDPEVADYAQRVVRMRDGRVIADERNPAPVRAADALARLNNLQAAE
ncbi:MAG: ABC transporter ATP-binding protein [Alphaproteobacteria bacterium]